ncbi:scarecrow-like protein 8 [Bidens hawaiensis]|uniref:scarecrow-like protein 8 n=1 Tax=Bidens hawaiensis TaxID=980011 RepID=UPI0040495274
MPSGFPGDYFNVNNTGRSIPLNNNTTTPQYRSPLADSSSHMDLIGKRSLAEFQQQRHIQQQAAFFLRNVKHRPYNPLVDLTSSPEISSVSINTTSSGSRSVPRYGVPVMQQFRSNSFNNLGNGNFNGVMGSNFHNSNNNNPSRVSLNNLTAKQSQETEGKMRKRLQELEKELLLDDEDGENDVVSGVTNSEWSETIQNILGGGPVTKPDNLLSLSPTSSSSSSCASSSASPAATICLTQLLADAAAAIADGKLDSATEIVNRIGQVANAGGSPEQRLSFCMTSALRARLSLAPAAVSELYGKEHILATQLLYDKSVCFKLGFMAANEAILDAGKQIHVVDFDIGKGVQYVYLLHVLATARDKDAPTEVSLKITTFVDFGNGVVEVLNLVGDGLKSLANKLDVKFSFCVLNFSLSELDSASLMVEPDEVLVVNFAFKLYKLPDESVTTENLRDEVLRRVKGLSPALVTVVEQELNANTASFETRVSQVAGYYGALLESLDATMGRGESDRVRIEEGLSRKIVNSVACEGRDRVERCEVFGKWRVRMSMAGFEPRVLSQLNADSLLQKVYSVSLGNPGFTAKEDAGGISFGWKGRTLTVASAWH